MFYIFDILSALLRHFRHLFGLFRGIFVIFKENIKKASKFTKEINGIYLESNFLCTVCELAAEGIIGLIAPSYPPVAPILESICIKLEIPYIEYMRRTVSADQEMTINFFPDDDLLAEGYAAIVKSMKWNSFTVLYESSESLVKLRNVLQLNATKDNPIILRQIRPGDDYR